MKARKPSVSAAIDAMKRYAAGEESAFKELYDFLVPHLYRYCDDEHEIAS
jgi:hypothetical protein